MNGTSGANLRRRRVLVALARCGGMNSYGEESERESGLQLSIHVGKGGSVVNDGSRGWLWRMR